MLSFDRSQIDKKHFTDAGFLRVKGILTRTGVFVYRNPDGTARRELRHPDDVFDAASLDSLRMAPVTLEHPVGLTGDGLLNAENASGIIRGSIGDLIQHDGKHITGTLVVTDQEAIHAVENGYEELSCGYTKELEIMAGEYDGQPYDARQKNIRYNHVAIVKKGRAGDTRISLDAALQQNNFSEEEEMSEAKLPELKQVVIDGALYSAEPRVLEELAKTKASLDAAEAVEVVPKDEFSKLEAERDSLKASLDAAEKQANDFERINAAVKERLAVIQNATVALDSAEGLLEMEDSEIMKKVILHSCPEASLDGKDGVYIQARFDHVIESLGKKNAEKNRQNTTEVSTDHADAAADAYSKMVERYKNAYKGGN